MKYLRLKFWFGLASILLLLAAATEASRAAEGTNYYLPAGKIDVAALLAPPPLPHSAEQSADLAEVRLVHHSHPPGEEAIALMENTNLSLYDFAPVFGIFAQPAKVPITEAFFHHIFRDTAGLVNFGKDYWKRDRPFIADPSLLQGERTPGFSYPSGHSTIGTVYALVLAEMFPEKRDAILTIGRNIGWHRVMLAKHYPTDVMAGRVLAQAIVHELKANPDFQRDLQAAKAEIMANTPAPGQ